MTPAERSFVETALLGHADLMLTLDLEEFLEDLDHADPARRDALRQLAAAALVFVEAYDGVRRLSPPTHDSAKEIAP